MTSFVRACPEPGGPPGSPAPEPGYRTESSASGPPHRCYIEHGDGSACTLEARYEAHLNWTAGLMLLCEDHAAEERACGDVIEIRTIR